MGDSPALRQSHRFQIEKKGVIIVRWTKVDSVRKERNSWSHNHFKFAVLQ
jgi:hypothetical protein